MKKLYFLAVFASARLVAQVPTASLVAYWPMDGTAADLSGNGNNGTMTNVSPVRDRFGNPNKALYFNGVNSKIVVPHSASINMVSTDFTISFWEKSSGNNMDRDILEKQVAGSWNGYGFTAGNVSNFGYCTAPKHIYFYTASGAMQDACTNDSILSDSSWHCVTGVYKASVNRSYLYIDGTLQADTGSASGPTGNTISLGIGFCFSYNSRFFHGTLDNIRMYKYALSPSEILAVCNDKRESVGIVEAEAPEHPFALYPNPGNGDLTVRLPGKDSPAGIMVFDQCGREVYKSQVSDNETIYTGLAAGVYVARIMQDRADSGNYKLVVAGR
ncbi:MAG: LamG-like jellyroll fold domain-containing protein [Bacteroidia bacterium]